MKTPTCFCLAVLVALFALVAIRADEPSSSLKDFICPEPDGAIPPPKVGGIRMITYGFKDGAITNFDYPQGTTLQLPILNNDEIVPVVGHMYRVSGQIRFKWIPDKDLPEGLKPVAIDSMIVPYRRNDHGVLSMGLRGTLCFVKMTKEKLDGREFFSAKLEFRGTDKIAGTVIVKEKDILVLQDTGGFEVRSIVPENKNTKVIGWVELSSKPIPEADLIKAKTKYIKITPGIPKEE